MAQRYGGEYSPDGTQTSASKPMKNAKRKRAGGRANLLFVAPLPMIGSVFGAGPVEMTFKLAALGALLLAAWLTREGLIAEEAYNARRIARRPAIPRKMFAAALIAVGLALASFSDASSLIEPVLYGVVGLVLHVLAFGIDPLKDKTAEGIDTFQTDRVAKAVEEAEAHLTAMAEAAGRTRDRQIEQRVSGFADTARDLFRTVESDPRDLTSVRKYLGVYLLGARDATIKYADLAERAPSQEARADYLSLLDDLQQNFADRTRKLMVNDKADLDVEIGVLRDRLAREGIRHTE